MRTPRAPLAARTSTQPSSHRLCGNLLVSALAACGVTTTFSAATPTRAGRDRDPRDGTTLRMVRAGEGLADYEVPALRYGADPSEVLRVECNTGRPLGFVPR